MANADSIFNGQGETLDPVIGTDGTVFLKAAGDAIGVPSGSSDPAAPQLVQEIKAGTATRTNVNDAASSTTLLAANASRKGVIIVNDSTEILYLGLGAVAASTTSYSYKLLSEDTWEDPFHFTGEIRGIWAANGSGAARITELT